MCVLECRCVHTEFENTKNKLSLVLLHFGCNLSHEIRCGAFHLGCDVGTQKVSDFETFWIWDVPDMGYSTCSLIIIIKLVL